MEKNKEFFIIPPSVKKRKIRFQDDDDEEEEEEEKDSRSKFKAPAALNKWVEWWNKEWRDGERDE